MLLTVKIKATSDLNNALNDFDSGWLETPQYHNMCNPTSVKSQKILTGLLSGKVVPQVDNRTRESLGREIKKTEANQSFDLFTVTILPLISGIVAESRGLGPSEGRGFFIRYRFFFAGLDK
jgi:hypothetical protein